MEFFSSVIDPARYESKVSAKYVTVDSRQLAKQILSQRDEQGNLLFNPNESQLIAGKGSRHIMRFRTNLTIKIGDEVSYPELIVTNSYKRESSLTAKFGIYRLVCSNGLTIAKKEWGTLRIRHIGSPALMASEIVKEFSLKLMDLAKEQARLMKATLTEEQAIQFALQAAQARWKRKFSKDEAKKLLQAARSEDNSNSVWHIFNRVQEKLICGDDSTLAISGSRSSRIRPLKSPAAIDRVNSSLYAIADQFATDVLSN